MSSSRLLYGAVAFLSAFLLFAVEPIAARQLLPVLGGSSAVWITCLVFFQLALLAGYLYAHWIAKLAPRLQRIIHLALLIAAIAQIALSELLHPGLAGGASHPVATVFAFLALTIGLPFLLLSSTSPLLQMWLYGSETDDGDVERKVWYRLFALSNAGSFLALLAYPALFEPLLTLHHQRLLWRLGFAVFAVASAALTTKIRAVATAPAEDSQGLRASSRQRWLWFLLPMAAAMQLSAVTSHLTMNIAAIPLLWVLPLAAYLATFILAFEVPSFYRRGLVVRVLILFLASLGYALSKTDFSLPIILGIAFFLLECFVACFFCHAEAYALRPQRASETTLFYLLVAAGGAAGTFFIGIVCPLVFSSNYDLALAFLATAALALAVTWYDGWMQRALWATGTVLLFALTLMLHRVYATEALLQVRNFYGTLRVKQTDANTPHLPMRTLLNGTIEHGTQLFSPDYMRIPTTYYAKDSGIGLTLRFCCEGRPRNIGVVGLGAGTLAAYGHPGDRIRFYEINPKVRPIAQNLFTYLRDSPASITFVEGDARTSLTAEPPQHFDVLAVDAFSGDAIPLHLLTTQAMALYRRHLAPGGVLAFHVSNQYLSLAPELALLAADAKMEVYVIETPSNDSIGEYRAEWVLMSSDPSFFQRPEIAIAINTIPPIPWLHVWTDDYASLVPILRVTGD